MTGHLREKPGEMRGEAGSEEDAGKGGACSAKGHCLWDSKRRIRGSEVEIVSGFVRKQVEVAAWWQECGVGASPWERCMEDVILKHISVTTLITDFINRCWRNILGKIEVKLCLILPSDLTTHQKPQAFLKSQMERSIQIPARKDVGEVGRSRGPCFFFCVWHLVSMTTLKTCVTQLW